MKDQPQDEPKFPLQARVRVKQLSDEAGNPNFIGKPATVVNHSVQSGEWYYTVHLDAPVRRREGRGKTDEDGFFAEELELLP